jgi:hypothetical protein
MRRRREFFVQAGPIHSDVVCEKSGVGSQVQGADDPFLIIGA